MINIGILWSHIPLETYERSKKISNSLRVHQTRPLTTPHMTMDLVRAKCSTLDQLIRSINAS